MTASYTQVVPLRAAHSSRFAARWRGAVAAVVCVAAAGSVSPAASATATVVATADAYVTKSKPTVNFGTASKLRVRRNRVRSYVRFDVAALPGPVSQATLRIRSASTSAAGYEVRSVADSSWGEETITYSNAPAVSPAVTAVSGPIASGAWTSVDVTPLVAGEGTFTFALTTTSTTTLSLTAREAGAASAPQLTIVTGDPTAGDPVIAAAGDIACDPSSPTFNNGLGDATSCRQMATSELLTGAGLAAVLTLGDNQYECGGGTAFARSYDPSWGRVKGITRPAVGNHEYKVSSDGTGCDPTATAAGYFGYFGSAAGDPGKGYYSFDVGAWHLVALNSNCSKVGGCGAGSAQEQWLRQDLIAHPAACTLAYWHHPLFSSGNYAPGVPAARPLYKALYDNGADVVLSGHDHIYERFARQDPNGALDLTSGIRQFVVGTGGKSHYVVGAASPNSEFRSGSHYGVLRLTLHPAGFDWSFMTEAHQVLDSGTDRCHGTVAGTGTSLGTSF